VSKPYREGVQTDALECALVKEIPSRTNLSKLGVWIRELGFNALTSPYPMSSAKMMIILGAFEGVEFWPKAGSTKPIIAKKTTKNHEILSIEYDCYSVILPL
jgi:hypothetical protein